MSTYGRTTIAVAGALALLAGAAFAGEGRARAIALPGDRATGTGVADLLPDDIIGIDAAGQVLFHSVTDDNGVFEEGWFLGTASSRKLVILQGAALPGGGGVDVSGRDLTFANPVFLNQSGRAGIIGSSNTLADLDAILTTNAQGTLRTVAAVLKPLPGVCAYRPRGVGEDITSAIVHDDFAFFPGNVGSEFGQTQPCDAEDDHGPTLLMRQGTNDAVQIAYNGLAVPLRPNTEFRQNFRPKGAFADGSLVFTATVDVPDSATNKDGIFTYKPGVGLFTVAVRDEAAPGTGSTISSFGPVRIVDGATNTFVEVVWAARLPTNDYVIYSTRENSGSAPIVQTGATDGAYELVVGQQTPTGFEILPGPLGQLIIVGATTGPDLPFGKGVGVWRYDPLAQKKMTLIAYDGMTFGDGALPTPNTATVTELQTVNVNASGRVAMRVMTTHPLIFQPEAILIEDAEGTFRCALIGSDEVPTRDGTATVGQMGLQITGFPQVTGSGADGHPSLFGANGEIGVFLNGTLGKANGVYAVSLDDAGPGPGPGPDDPNIKARLRRGVLRLQSGRVRGEYGLRVEQGAVVVTGKNGTLVNGSAAPFRAEGAKKVITKLGKEGGSVEITGGEGVSTPPSIRITGGPSDDVIDVSGATLKDIAISLGRDGADAVTIHNTTVTRNVTISAPRSETVYDLRGLEVLGRVHLRMGDLGTYGVTLEDCEIAGPLTLIGGRAGGEIAFNGSTCSKLTLNTARATRDSHVGVVIADSSLDERCKVLAGKGALSVALADSMVAGKAIVLAQRAAGLSFDARDSTIEESLTIRSGAGPDVVRLRDSIAPGVVKTGGGADVVEVDFVDVSRLRAELFDEVARRNRRRMLIDTGKGDDEIIHRFQYSDGMFKQLADKDFPLKFWALLFGGPGEDKQTWELGVPLTPEERAKLDRVIDLHEVRFEVQAVIALAKR